MRIVSPELEGFFKAGDLFEQVASLEGEMYREVANRKTFRVELGGRAYFAKVHVGVGWYEIIKNLLQGRWPVLGAGNEWKALNRLAELGVDSMEPVVFFESGVNPATRKSCIVTKALTNMVSLEEFVLGPSFNFRAKRRLITKLAGISRLLHENGINHRDYYLCHFLMDRRQGFGKGQPLRLYLIDLHRAQLREKTPVRWKAKDVGGLLYSALGTGLTKRDLYRFIKTYTGLRLRQALDQPFWADVVRRARGLYLQEHPSLPADVGRLLGEA